MVTMAKNGKQSLTSLAHRHFPDADIVIGEGFKEARQVAKIEVFRSASATPPPPRLQGDVTGIIAVASDDAVTGDHIFRLSEAAEIASFIEKRFLHDTVKGAEHTTLLIDGDRVPMKSFVQDALAGTVHGFVESLKLSSKGCRTIDIRITLPDK
jgi:molybdopterin-guanine dinucleotide biosynthesis protein B